jgi:hypothetical protein
VKPGTERQAIGYWRWRPGWTGEVICVPDDPFGAIAFEAVDGVRTDQQTVLPDGAFSFFLPGSEDGEVSINLLRAKDETKVVYVFEGKADPSPSPTPRGKRKGRPTP